jgi:hypothetical protein
VTPPVALRFPVALITTVPAVPPAANVPKLNSLVEATDRMRTTLAEEFTLPLAVN